MYLKKLKLEVTLHTIFSDCKNLQKFVLTNVNIQRTGKTSLQMFVYFIFDGSFICRCLYIFRPSSVPRHSICPPQLVVHVLIINYLYLQILHSASENNKVTSSPAADFLVGGHTFEVGGKAKNWLQLLILLIFSGRDNNPTLPKPH